MNNQEKLIKGISFIEQAVEILKPQSLEHKCKKVYTRNTYISYVFQLLSILTGLSFIAYVGNELNGVLFIISSLVLFILLAMIEGGKRILIKDIAKLYFSEGDIKYVSLFLLVIILGASASISYVGGSKIPSVIVSSQPIDSTQVADVVPSVQLDYTRDQLEEIATSIRKQEATTYKGRVTRTANTNLKILYDQQTTYQTTLLELEKEYQKKVDARNKALNDLKETRDVKIEGIGFIFGGIAVFSDIMLVFLLYFAYNALKKVYKKHQTSTILDAYNVTLEETQVLAKVPEIKELPEPKVTLEETQEKKVTLQETQDKTQEEKVTLQETPRKNSVKLPKTKKVEVVNKEQKYRRCDNCGASYEYKRPSSRFCSSKCRLENHNQKNK